MKKDTADELWIMLTDIFPATEIVGLMPKEYNSHMFAIFNYPINVVSFWQLVQMTICNFLQIALSYYDQNAKRTRMCLY